MEFWPNRRVAHETHFGDRRDRGVAAQLVLAGAGCWCCWRAGTGTPGHPRTAYGAYCTRSSASAGASASSAPTHTLHPTGHPRPQNPLPPPRIRSTPQTPPPIRCGSHCSSRLGSWTSAQKPLARQGTGAKPERVCGARRSLACTAHLAMYVSGSLDSYSAPPPPPVLPVSGALASRCFELASFLFLFARGLACAARQ